MNLTRHIFTPGARYRSKQSFMSGASTFELNETLIFEREGYSRYDNSYVYEFRSETQGDLKSWWLHEDKPVEEWHQLFEAIAA